jgi:hypothetical protein
MDLFRWRKGKKLTVQVNEEQTNCNNSKEVLWKRLLGNWGRNGSTKDDSSMQNDGDNETDSRAETVKRSTVIVLTNKHTVISYVHIT